MTDETTMPVEEETPTEGTPATTEETTGADAQ